MGGRTRQKERGPWVTSEWATLLSSLDFQIREILALFNPLLKPLKYLNSKASQRAGVCQVKERRVVVIRARSKEKGVGSKKKKKKKEGV